MHCCDASGCRSRGCSVHRARTVCNLRGNLTIWPISAHIRHRYYLVPCLCAFLSTPAASQSQTSGRIAGIVRDAQGAVIAGAEVVTESLATSDKHITTTNETGGYSVTLLPPAVYDLTIRAPGFNPAAFRSIAVGLSETITINASLQVARSNVEVTVSDAPPLVRSDSAELASTIDSRSLETLPLPTRNFLQLLTLAPGVTAPLTNNSAIGRNSPNVSVNGSRVTGNSLSDQRS